MLPLTARVRQRVRQRLTRRPPGPLLPGERGSLLRGAYANRLILIDGQSSRALGVRDARGPGKFLPSFWQLRRLDLGASAIFAGFFVAFFWRALFTGKFFVTADAFIYSYPLRTIVWQELRQGHLPLWTSQIMSGYPLLSMAQIGIGYPLTWFYLFLPGRFAETIYDLAPYLLFPIFIYCYLREIGRSRVAGILAGLSFGYGGFLISPVAYNGLLGNALMWLPLTLIALERSRTRRFSSCLLGATITYSLSVLEWNRTGLFARRTNSGGVRLVSRLADSPLRSDPRHETEKSRSPLLDFGRAGNRCW